MNTEFHYPGCDRMCLANRMGNCSCEELFDMKHADIKRRNSWLFKLLKWVTFKEIKL